MLHVTVPGGDDLWLEHLVLDVNGTLAEAGVPIIGVVHALAGVRAELALHIVSADTFGTAEELAGEIRAHFCRVATGADKLSYLNWLGAGKCAAIGNGRNDAQMLAAAALGVAVTGPEGAHSEALTAADIVTRSIAEALTLLTVPELLTATLRP